MIETSIHALSQVIVHAQQNLPLRLHSPSCKHVQGYVTPMSLQKILMLQLLGLPDDLVAARDLEAAIAETVISPFYPGHNTNIFFSNKQRGSD